MPLRALTRQDVLLIRRHVSVIARRLRHRATSSIRAHSPSTSP